MQFNKKLYDTLKWIAQIFLPAIAAAYFSFAGLFDLENAEQVVGTITIIDTLLGVLLGISQSNYSKNNEAEAGYLTQTGTDPDTGHPDLALTITKDPKELVGKDTVTLKVGAPPTA